MTIENPALQGSSAGAIVPRAGARITVELDWDTLQPGVQVYLQEAGGPKPPDPAELRAWEQGAIYGVRYALGVANTMPCTVRITELSGDVHCMNPTLVAAAAATAVWEALEFEPAEPVRDSMRERVRESGFHKSIWLGTFAD